MTEPLSPEAASILERLRRQIAVVQSGGATDAVDGVSMPEKATAASLELGVDSLAPLRAEVETAVSSHRDVGQINPRNPGFHNAVIQFVKKVMRRSLTWYTRPIHLFQGAVIRALQQVVSLLQGQREISMNLAQRLNDVANQAAEAHQKYASTREYLEGQIASAKNEVLAAASGQIASAKNEVLAAASGQIASAKNEVLAAASGQIASAKNEVLAAASGQIASAKNEVLAAASGQIASAKNEVLAAASGQIASAKNEVLAAASGQIASAKNEVLAAASGQIANMQADLSEKIGDSSGRIDSIRSETLRRLEQLKDIVDKLRSEEGELQAVVRQQRLRERDVRRLVDAMQRDGVTVPSEQARAIPPMFPSELRHQNEFDYFAFEDRFRGDESLIRERQESYVEYFQGREGVVDIGCGRGEFLELLRDNGITARGVELGLDQYLLCREKGLDVVQQDLFGFLESLPDESIGGLFSAQVIEHLTASDQLRYVALAHRKCKRGSPVVFETINAQCVYAVVRNFFLDPTHVRPIHPETLKFAMQSLDFKNVKLKYMAPVVEGYIPPLIIGGNLEETEGFNVAIRHLNDLIYGSQDFAAIGWR